MTDEPQTKLCVHSVTMANPDCPSCLRHRLDAATLRADRAEEALERVMKVVEAAKEWANVSVTRLGVDGPEVGKMLAADDKLIAALDALDADQEAANG